MLGCELLVARTLTALAVGTPAGAAYSPLALTVPQTLLPPATPLTSQVTVLMTSGA